MQHDIVRKKLNYDLLTTRVCVGSEGKIFATMLLHLVIPFNLICNTTMRLTKLNFDLLIPSPGSAGA